MGQHRKQEHLERVRWYLVLLVPFWVLQMSFLLCLMGIFSYRLAETTELLKDETKRPTVTGVKIGWEICNVVFSLLSLGLNTAEVAKLVAENLTPLMMLVSHSIKTLLALAVLGLDIAVHVQKDGGKYTVIGMGIDCGLILATIAPTIYSIVVYRRQSEYSDHQEPESTRSYGLKHSIASTPQSQSRLELGSDSYAEDSDMSPKQSTTTTRSNSRSSPKSASVVVTTRTRSVRSVRSDRRFSTASSILAMFDTNPASSGESLDAASSVASTPLEPYSHERSTDFDEYVKRRSVVYDAGGSSPGAVSSLRGARCVSWATSRGLLPVPEGHEDGAYFSGAAGAGDRVYAAYNPYRKSCVSIVSAALPPNSPPDSVAGFVVAPSSYRGAYRNRITSAPLDMTAFLPGSVPGSDHTGSHSMSRGS